RRDHRRGPGRRGAVDPRSGGLMQVHTFSIVIPDASRQRVDPGLKYHGGRKIERVGGLEHDPEKWGPGFGKNHTPKKKLKRDDDSKRSHHALGPGSRALRRSAGMTIERAQTLLRDHRSAAYNVNAR